MILNKATISFSAILIMVVPSTFQQISFTPLPLSLSLCFVSFIGKRRDQSIKWWLSNCSNVRRRKFSFVSISVFSIDYMRLRSKLTFQRAPNFSFTINYISDVWNIFHSIQEDDFSSMEFWFDLIFQFSLFFFRGKYIKL